MRYDFLLNIYYMYLPHKNLRNNNRSVCPNNMSLI